MTIIDVITHDKQVKVIADPHGISKEDIKVNAYNDRSVGISSNKPEKRFYHIIDLPAYVDIETAKATYKNRILEIAFNKKKIL